MGTNGPPPPAIATRLGRALLGWALVWGLAVGLAIWLAATHEVDELLDDTLQSSAELLPHLLAVHTAQNSAPSLARPASTPGQTPASPGVVGQGVGLAPTEAVARFAWQLVGPDGQVLARSSRAPAQAWQTQPRPGFSHLPDWRLYGLATGQAGQMLYAAQTRAERLEARHEVTLGAVLATLAVGLLGQLWLRARVRHELEPLQRLSHTLAGWDMAQGPPSAVLGAPQRAELVPVHQAIEGLASRLSVRLASEQAFSAHAAHALRTPLAGIDAQLAVAARSAPPELAERLKRVRGAAARLQHVVVALLGLFRSADGTAALQRASWPLAALVQRLPSFDLVLQVQPGAQVQADADLLSAALLNLLDNAQRHGARTVALTMADNGRVLQLRDDGQGLAPAQHALLCQALAEQRYTDTGGLGLMLADRVARAHGGRITLPTVPSGFAVDIELPPP